MAGVLRKTHSLQRRLQKHPNIKMQKSSLALFVGYVLYEGLVRFRTFNRFEIEGLFSGLSNVILTPQYKAVTELLGFTVITVLTRKYSMKNQPVMKIPGWKFQNYIIDRDSGIPRISTPGIPIFQNFLGFLDFGGFGVCTQNLYEIFKSRSQPGNNPNFGIFIKFKIKIEIWDPEKLNPEAISAE